MKRVLAALVWVLVILALLSLLHSSGVLAAYPAAAGKYRSVLTREAHFVKGLTAPIPMYAAQIEQESGWRPGVTAWDKGRGLAQFMDGTTQTIIELYPELGAGDPYNPVWAIRAMIRYDAWLVGKVHGKNDCEQRAAALKGYNAGVGYVQQAQRVSTEPGTWFGVTEYVKTRQSAKNFENSRMYPRWVLFKRQPSYTGWGAYTCGGE